jgi:hypothetical protein
MAQKEKILNHTLRALEINELCPNSIDGVVVSIDEDNKLRMDLHSSMSSEGFKKWFQGKGGIFSKDVKAFIKGKPTGKYILMEGEGERTILRLIEDEEFPAFEIRKLVDGKLKDKAYMLLRSLQEGESLTTSTRYIEEIELPIEESEPLDMPHPDDEDSVIQSMQLFTD